MEFDRHDQGRGLVVHDDQKFGRPTQLTLRVPARPEAIGIVRLVLMSCGAAAGIELDEIFARSHEMADAFASLLVDRPEATSIVISAHMEGREVDLVPITETDD
jgi:hypothetical protein